MSALGELWSGFTAVPRGAGLILRRPELRRLAALPAVVSGVLFVAVVGLCWWLLPGLLERWWPGLAGGHFLARLLAAVAGVAAGVLAFVFGSGLVAQPFLDPLAGATEQVLGAAPAAERFSARAMLRELALAGWDVAFDLTAFVALQVLLLATWLVPGAGWLHPVLGWLVTVWLAAMEMATPALARHGLHGPARWRALGRRRWRGLGLGVAVTLLLLVPLLQLLTLPVAVVAGTLVVCEAEPVRQETT
ncbi:MAG: EI24 domain-containing protein [Armatimonadetes bacterium]|nr:EI24 domain-containing protein [Armatimonadota bacterium]